jgi:alpha-N-arabinofuranosidase
MFLTRGERMIVTPTYHVFDLYQVHQSGSLLPVEVAGPNYSLENITLPMISASASRDGKGVIHMSLVNLDPNRPVRIATKIVGANARSVSGRILTADAMDARPDFEDPDRVAPAPLRAIKVNAGAIDVTVAPKSVVMLEIR